MDKKWNEKTLKEKALELISLIAFCVWMVFEYVESKTQMQAADYVNCLCVCIICVCQAISFWNRKRVFSYIAVAGIICLIAVMILMAL